MAIHFQGSSFGQVVINGREYGDVLVIGEKVKERDEARLRVEVGGHHCLGEFEVEELLSNNPEIVVIGSGTAGAVRVTEEVEERFEAVGIELRILLTPEAITEFNRLYEEGKRVNALIHTTC